MSSALCIVAVSLTSNSLRFPSLFGLYREYNIPYELLRRVIYRRLRCISLVYMYETRRVITKRIITLVLSAKSMTVPLLRRYGLSIVTIDYIAFFSSDRDLRALSALWPPRRSYANRVYVSP